MPRIRQTNTLWSHFSWQPGRLDRDGAPKFEYRKVGIHNAAFGGGQVFHLDAEVANSTFKPVGWWLATDV
jgi:hypothetical protein